MTVAAAQAPRTRSLEHLEARLGLLETQVAAAVARRRLVDPNPDDRFKGLYLSEEAVDDLLARDRGVRAAPPDPDAVAAVEMQADAWQLAGEELRLRATARTFDLDDTDVALLVVALAPDLDPRFESLYGYLHDDVTRRRASVGLALELAGLSTTDAPARDRLSGHGALVRHGIVVVEGAERPLLTRALRVRDRIIAHLLGSDASDPELARVSAHAAVGEAHAPLVRALTADIRLVYLREEGVASGVSIAIGSAWALETPTVAVDLVRLAAAPQPAELAAEALREACLRRALLVAGPIAALANRGDAIRLLAESGWPTVLVGSQAWDPAWSPVIPLQLDAPQPDTATRVQHWRQAIEVTESATNGHVAELLGATRAFQLGITQIERAAAVARLRAVADGREVEPEDLRAGARAQNSAGLERLARRIEPSASWGDLVLPPDVHAQLRELAARARHRERVLDDWQIGGRSSRGRGITALFGGESGTGKTLAAEVIAGELGLDLYVIDLSTVIDKYIGETEKNLDRIFSEAERVNGVLLFDEADAIFGKRSEVRDARDRYANVEVAYLLQRMERFDGLAILTTNLRSNLDEAFTRRLDTIVDFPMPDEVARLALWRMHLPDRLPQADDLDLDFMAQRFRLAGGHVRNICLTAAYLAAERDSAVAMGDLVRGTEREYRKLGRLTLEDEFGPYYALVVADRR